MPVQNLAERRPLVDEQLAEAERLANVIPFSRTLLGDGALYGSLPRSADLATGSPVYLPGDRRLAE